MNEDFYREAIESEEMFFCMQAMRAENMATGGNECTVVLCCYIGVHNVGHNLRNLFVITYLL